MKFKKSLSWILDYTKYIIEYFKKKLKFLFQIIKKNLFNIGILSKKIILVFYFQFILKIFILLLKLITKILRLILSIILFLYNASSLRFIIEKTIPILKLKNRKTPSSLLLWIFSVYFTVYSISLVVYQNRIEEIWNITNSYTAFLTNSFDRNFIIKLPEIQRLASPIKPSLTNPFSSLYTLLKYDHEYDLSIGERILDGWPIIYESVMHGNKLTYWLFGTNKKYKRTNNLIKDIYIRYKDSLNKLNLEAIEIDRIGIDKANFSYSNLSYGILIDLKITNSLLKESKLQQVNFAYAEIKNCLLDNSDFLGSFFYRTKIDTSLMSNVNLNQCTIILSFFNNCDLRNSTFDDAFLIGCDFSNAMNLNLSTLVKAKSLYKSKFPEDIMKKLTKYNSNLFMVTDDLKEEIKSSHYRQHLIQKNGFQ